MKSKRCEVGEPRGHLMISIDIGIWCKRPRKIGMFFYCKQLNSSLFTILFYLHYMFRCNYVKKALNVSLGKKPQTQFNPNILLDSNFTSSPISDTL